MVLALSRVEGATYDLGYDRQMSNRASLTAEYMALFRALESSRPARSRLFCDPLAPVFLHEARKWFYRLARISAGRRLLEGLLDRIAPGARAAGIARTKWIDDQVEEALERIAQLVLLGAGFDTRAYRLACAERAVTFELDRAETSSVKQSALRKKTRIVAGTNPICADRLQPAVNFRNTRSGWV